MADVDWSIEALQDLDRLGEFLEETSPEFARRFVRRIVAAANSLSDFPRRGRAVPELHRDNVRELIFQNYRIIYRVTEKVVILGVIHGRVNIRRVMSRRSWDLP